MPRETETLETVQGPKGAFVLHKHALTEAQRNSLFQIAARDGFERFLVNLPNTMSLKRAITLPYRQNGEMKIAKIMPDGSIVE